MTLSVRNTTPESNIVERNIELDIIKGFLIFVMIIYHCASGSNIEEVKFLRSKLQFLHYAFLIISGFLCSYYYVPRFQKSPLLVQRRLFVRGLKLIAIVLIINIIFRLPGLLSKADSLSEALSLPWAISKLIDSGKGNDIAFEVLFFIGLFLMTSSFIIRFRFRLRFLFSILFLLLPLITDSYSVMFLAYGYLGFIIGLYSHTHQFSAAVKWARANSVFFFLALVVEFAFLAPLARLLPLQIFAISLETVLWFTSFVYLFSLLHGRYARGFIIFSGKYTLFAYMAHVLFIKIVFRYLSILHTSGYLRYTFLLIIVSLLTFATLWGLNFLRRWKFVTNIYNVVFN